MGWDNHQLRIDLKQSKSWVIFTMSYNCIVFCPSRVQLYTGPCCLSCIFFLIIAFELTQSPTKTVDHSSAQRFLQRSRSYLVAELIYFVEGIAWLDKVI